MTTVPIILASRLRMTGGDPGVLPNSTALMMMRDEQKHREFLSLFSRCSARRVRVGISRLSF